MDKYLDTIEAVKKNLADYIIEKVTEIKRHRTDVTFRCLNPNHPDRNPSMFVDQRIPHIAHCRSCGVSMSIFHVHHHLESAPLYGRAFLEDNVNVLAVKYGIEPIDVKAMSEDELHKFNVYQVHQTASDLISEALSGFINTQYTTSLGISEEVRTKMGIGTIKDYDKFILEIATRGNWTVEEVTNWGLTSNLFGPEKITYTIHDVRGRPIAFATRDLKYDGRFGITKEEEITDAKGIIKKRPKWYNSFTSVIYEKSDTLYGYHYALKEEVSKVYVVEGYADAAVMWSHGLRNVVCVGSTAFSPKHVQMLKEAQIGVVIICLDNDDPGLAATDRILEDGFKSIPFIKAQILQVPHTFREDGKTLDVDPDSFIRTYGKEAFEALKPMSAFQYTINRIPDELKSDEEKSLFVERFLPIIMNEPSAITQQQMRKAIALRIGLSEHLIKEEQINRERIYNMQMRERLKNEFKITSKKFYESLDLSPEQSLPIITNFREKVNNEMNSAVQARLGVHEVIEEFDAWKKDRETTTRSDQCLKTGFDFIDEEWGGIPRNDAFVGFTAAPNAGKSALLMNLAVGILENNDPSKFMCLYWTIDDNKRTLYDKLISILSSKEIYKVNALSEQSDEVKKDIHKAIQKVDKWIRYDLCLSVKDSDIGKSGDDCKNWVLSMQDKFPEKTMVLFIDNFANMTGHKGEELADEHYNIEILHELRVKYNVAVISSFEVNKEGSEGRLTNKSQRGSQKKQFRATLSFNVYNELGEAQNAGRTNAKNVWFDKIGDKYPIIETTVSKNKLNCKTSFKGSLYWKFLPTIGTVSLIGDYQKLNQFYKENDQQKKHRGIGLENWSSVWNKTTSAAPVPEIKGFEVQVLAETIDDNTDKKSLINTDLLSGTIL